MGMNIKGEPCASCPYTFGLQPCCEGMFCEKLNKKRNVRKNI